MLKRIVVLCFSVGCAYAGSMGSNHSSAASFFVGLGGRFDSVKIDQYLDPLIGTTNIYLNNNLVAYGTASGPAIPFHNTQTTFAPTAQTGYFRHLTTAENHDIFWGGKFTYQYLGMTLTNSDIVSPQVGSLTPVTSDGVGFTGRATIQSAQNQVNHVLALMPLIGERFSNSQFYLGLGPTLFGTQTYLNNVSGFADIEGTHVDVSGSPVNFEIRNWVWGGSAQVGFSYFVNSSWFLDISYSYAMSPNNNTVCQSSFSGNLSGGYVKNGTLYGVSSQYVTVQGASLSINKLMDV